MRIRVLFILLSVLLFSINSYSDIIYSDGLNYSTEPVAQDNSSDAGFDDNSFAPATYNIYSSDDSSDQPRHHYSRHSPASVFSGSPKHIAAHKEKVIIVNPRTHTWAAYSANGVLIRSGRASAGSSWCNDLGRSCRTTTGTFRIYSLGSEDCVSSKFPLGEGGAPMPYCMYFNGSQGLHGSNEIYGGNRSHGCVRVSVSDARWIRYNFAHVGTKVIVKSY